MAEHPDLARRIGLHPHRRLDVRQVAQQRTYDDLSHGVSFSLPSRIRWCPPLPERNQARAREPWMDSTQDRWLDSIYLGV